MFWQKKKNSIFYECLAIFDFFGKWLLKELYDFVPFTGDDEYGIYSDQGIVGDQLTIERAVNGHASLRNGFTSKQRSKGQRFKIAEWHAGNRFFSSTVNPKRLKLAYCHTD